MSHLLVIANETLPGRQLYDAVRERAAADDTVTVIAPVNTPSSGYVVYEDTRRAAAGRRLERTLQRLREGGVHAHGLVVEADPAQAVKDAVAQLDPPIDGIVISTHPEERSGWLRRSVIERVRDAAKGIPVHHVVTQIGGGDDGETNVLVIANETVVGEALLDRIRQRAQERPSSFLIVCPQADPAQSEHPEAERRLRRALTVLRSEGIEAHGQVAHPDPFTAAVQAIRDERVDEIIVSTFPGERQSSWLRGNIIERLKRETSLPVEHVEVAVEAVEGAR